jgi:hypothetical protein
MECKRKFIIKVDEFGNIWYIKEIYQNSIGCYYTKTRFKKKAKFWRYKKSCENSIQRIKNDIDPTKQFLHFNILEIIEITDKQTLRAIKLKKLSK